jgi:REP element-mobilizing transposase RayT
MPRTPRKELAGGIHHVYNRGNHGETLFVDDTDRAFFLAELDACATEYRWIVLAYCLMPNHLHLVLETPETTLGLGMRRLAGHYAQGFNRRHQPKGGHVFQGRFGSTVADSDEYVAHLLRYVAMNPVMACLCASPEEWRWSSHRDLLAGRGAAARARGRIEVLLEPWGGMEGRRYASLFEVDSAEFGPFAGAPRWSPRPSLDVLLGTPRDQGRIHTARAWGYRLNEIAAILGVHESTISRWLRRGV